MIFVSKVITSKWESLYWFYLASSMTINLWMDITFKCFYRNKSSCNKSTLCKVENGIKMRKILSKEILFVIRIWTIHHRIPTVNTISFCFLSYSLFLPPHQWILDILILRIVVAHQTAKGIIFWLFVHPFWFIFTVISPTEFLQRTNIWRLYHSYRISSTLELDYLYK